jgi:hypothetical protein
MRIPILVRSLVALLFLESPISPERSDRRFEGSTDLVCCLCSAPLEALFADSVATGRRSKIYTWRGMVNSLARGLG